MRKKLKEHKLKAIHEHDIMAFIKNIGLSTDLKEGRLRCAFCKCSITEDNVGGFYISDGKIKVYCDNLKCHHLLLKRKEGVVNA